jgi:outer membrane protein assembly factor BamB
MMNIKVNKNRAQTKIKLLNRHLINPRRCSRVTGILVVSMLLFSLSVFCLPNLGSVEAQSSMPSASGQVQKIDTVWHIISNVNVGDQVVLSITPSEGNPAYVSAVYYPNMTLLSSVSYYGGPTSKSHSYQFTATQSGNYMLKIWTDDSAAFNYTVKCSHAISSGKPLAAAPYSVTGEVQKVDTAWYLVSDVNQGDCVLLAVTPPAQNSSYVSAVYYPNMTLLSSISHYGRPTSGSHSYQFIAAKTGTYLLKIWTDSESAFNFTLKCSHVLSSAVFYNEAGAVETVDTTWHLVSDVNVGDQVVLSVNPSDGNPGYVSAVYYPNMTLLSSVSYYGGPTTGSHSYQFIATNAGNYLLKIWTDSDNAFNYTVKSSHTLSFAIAYSENGEVQKVDTVWHSISNVNAGDLVAVSVTPSTGDPAYLSSMFYPNATLLQSTDHYGRPIEGSHSYQFIATNAGNYLLKISTDADTAFNYTVKSSHQLGLPTPNSSPSTSESSSPSPSPSPSPTDSSSPTQTDRPIPADTFPPSQPTAGGSTWPMFRQDPSHAGYSPSTAPDTNNVLWTYSIDFGDNASMPIVADGRVFFGSDSGEFYCLNASNGNYLWSSYTSSWISADPVVYGADVYFGSSNGFIYCFDEAYGTQMWSISLAGDAYPSSPLTIVNDVLFFGDSNGTVYALSSLSGNGLWTFQTGEFIDSAPAVVDGKVYVGSENGVVYRLDASTGLQDWSFPTGSFIVSAPSVVDGKVYVGSWDNCTYCSDADSGEEIWSYMTGGYVSSSPSVVYQNAYVGSYDGNVYCFEATSGDVQWTFPTDNAVVNSPAVADGKVYVASYDGYFYCIDASTGSLVWKYLLGTNVFTSAAIAYGIVYVCSDDKVYAFGSLEQIQMPSPSPSPSHSPTHSTYSSTSPDATHKQTSITASPITLSTSLNILLRLLTVGIAAAIVLAVLKRSRKQR